jgi:hypothetical protein
LSKWHYIQLGQPTVEQRDADPMGFLRKLTSLNKFKIVGFKIFLEHASRTNTLRLLSNPGWKKVVLFRDPMEVYASILRANATKVWVINHPNAEPDERLNVPVTFTPESWSAFSDAYSYYLERAWHIPGAHYISYDQLHDQSALARVLTYLGSKASAADLKAGTTKQFTKDRIEEGFTNWAEFMNHLKTASAPDTSKLVTLTKGVSDDQPRAGA